MQIDSNSLTIIGFVGTWIIFAFSVGVAYGSLQSQNKKNADDIVGVKTVLSEDLVEVKARVIEIESRFTTSGGEPRLLSYKAHDHLCLRANEAITAELRHVTAALTTNSQRIKDCGDQVAQLSTMVAILEERVEKQSEKNTR